MPGVKLYRGCWPRLKYLVLVSPWWCVTQAWLSPWPRGPERSSQHPMGERPESRLAFLGPSLPSSSATLVLGHWLSLSFPSCKTWTVMPVLGTSVKGLEKGLNSFPTHTHKHTRAGLPFQRRDFYDGRCACTNAAGLSILADSWVKSIWRWPLHHRSPQEGGWAERTWRGTRGAWSWNKQEEPPTCPTCCVISGHLCPSLGPGSPTHVIESQLRAGCEASRRRPLVPHAVSHPVPKSGVQ